ncbi:lactonase family protein [Granulicella sibirica]|uniref:6-phosphogluconolactonase n=1 Tax=Granulicella sibirica TaxID=2479048 RepID=A0A4Q0STT2_9BACT|nr:lactonase family protein [Granulicella sibirica]RXH54087.1 6-phosphogluconolactonase [Granulicella sibirica]
MLNLALRITGSLLALSFGLAAHAQNLAVVFGSHSSGPGEGFSIGRFDSATGHLTDPQLMLQADAPAYFVFDPSHRFLYTCGTPAFIAAYAVDRATGHLTLLNQKPSGGGDPSYISLDKTARFAFVANYQGGNIAAYALRPDGTLGERTAFIQHTGHSVNPLRQTRAFAHSILVDPSNRFVLVADLGLDKIFIYRFDAATGSLTPSDPETVQAPQGSGPRHITFHPNGRWAYLITEMGSSILLYDWDAKRGTLNEKQQISALPADFKGVSTSAEIRVHPNGRFLYATNRGRNSVAVFAIDRASGRLSPLQDIPSGGRTPRNFDFDPSGRWLLVTNHDSDTAAVFAINPDTGVLNPAGDPVHIRHAFSPRFLPLQP